MTRVSVKKLTAITLCIILVCTSLCTVACVTDQSRENAQFFAADFSFLESPKTEQSLSGGDIRIVSWLRNPDATVENEMASALPRAVFNLFADRLQGEKADKPHDFYTGFKTAEYFLRI